MAKLNYCATTLLLLNVFSFFTSALAQLGPPGRARPIRYENVILRINDETTEIITAPGAKWFKKLPKEPITVAEVVESPEGFSCVLWSADDAFVSPTFSKENPLREPFTGDKVICFTPPKYNDAVVLVESDWEKLEVAFINIGPYTGEAQLDERFAVVARAAIVATRKDECYCHLQYYSGGIRYSRQFTLGDPMLETIINHPNVVCKY